MITQPGLYIYCVDDVLAKISGMGSRKAYSPDSGNFAYRGQQFRERLLPCRIFIRIYILTQQLDFAITQVGHLPRFTKYRLRRAAAFFAAGKRHHAIGAKLVASFDDGDIAAVGVGACGKFRLKALVRFAIVESGNAELPCSDVFYLRQHLRQLAI